MVINKLRNRLKNSKTNMFMKHMLHADVCHTETSALAEHFAEEDKHWRRLRKPKSQAMCRRHCAGALQGLDLMRAPSLFAVCKLFKIQTLKSAYFCAFQKGALVGYLT